MKNLASLFDAVLLPKQLLKFKDNYDRTKELTPSEIIWRKECMGHTGLHLSGFNDNLAENTKGSLKFKFDFEKNSIFLNN